LKYPGRKIAKVDNLLPRVLADGWPRFTSDLGASGVSNVCALKFPGGKIIEVDDLLPRVLANGWSRFTSNVWALGVLNVGALKSLVGKSPKWIICFHVSLSMVGPGSLRTFRL
jgi:hypothetical protein